MISTEAAKCIMLMSAAYGPPEERQEELWLNLLSTMNYEKGRLAIEYWVMNEEWWPTPAAINSCIRQMTAGERPIAPRGNHCDSSGWVEHSDNSSTPCPTCNPVLYSIWSDPTKRQHYLNGVRVGSLSDSVEIGGDGKAYFVGAWPMSCLQAFTEDPDDKVVSVKKGRDIAAAAYANDCEARQVKPSWKFFDRAIGGK